MRTAAAQFLAIGVPTTRLGLMLGFQTAKGQGGREGLKPTSAWLEVVKLETLSARRVATELKLPTVWSWGWASYSQSPDDADKSITACVYLWTRAPGLCDGPAAAGDAFDDSRTEGQLVFPTGIICVADGSPLRADAMSAITSLTGDSQIAFTAMLGRVAARETYDPTTDEILAAERTVIALRFRGDRSAYVAALARAHAGVVVGRGVIADELRRAEIERRLRVAAPSERQIQSYYSTYAAVSARLISADPAPWWLGDRKSGLALGSLAPPQVFDLPTAGKRTVQTMERAYDVEALDDALPLGAIPLTAARPAIRSALVALARDDAYDTWLGTAREVAAQPDRLRPRPAAAGRLGRPDHLPPVPGAGRRRAGDVLARGGHHLALPGFLRGIERVVRTLEERRRIVVAAAHLGDADREPDDPGVCDRTR